MLPLACVKRRLREQRTWVVLLISLTELMAWLCITFAFHLQTAELLLQLGTAVVRRSTLHA